MDKSNLPASAGVYSDASTTGHAAIFDAREGRGNLGGTTARAGETPWSPVGYITYKRTYARRLDANDPASPTEEFPQTIERVLRACQEQLGCGFSDEEVGRLRGYFLGLKASVAGRFLWQLGTPTVDKLGLLSLQNCAFATVDSPIRPFTWTMDALMLGTGVGFNIQREFVYRLPHVSARSIDIRRMDTTDADFIVPDTREGWVRLLHHVLESYFVTGQGFSYSTLLIRGKGALIKGFGGLASGPEDLCNGVANICRVLDARRGKALRTTDALDVMNILGQVVVAGNVRRSAQIAIGDCDDLQYLRAKRWDLGTIPSWRAMSNNSVVCNDFSLLPEEFWEGYQGKGEPYGLINLRLSRAVGRTGETRYPDPDVQGFNPCAEQSLANYETCCLAEIVLPNVTSESELNDIARLLYRINKHSLRLPCHLKETEEIVHRNMRMGIGITGYLQAPKEKRDWLSSTYEHLRYFDAVYSETKGWPRSIKLTTVKPSGTLSLLPGVTPGVHPGYAQQFIRRIRFAANSPLLDAVRAHGYDVEPQVNFDGSFDHGTLVASFPMAYPPGTALAKDVTAIEQLEYVRELQANWSDNAVSCTVYYRPEELSGIRSYLAKNFNDNFKSLSFLLHSGHGFKQAPYEEISEEQYAEMKAKVRTIHSVNGDTTGDLDVGSECEGGACPIR